eukprot:765105-Hanusia_phi.AAC.4
MDMYCPDRCSNVHDKPETCAQVKEWSAHAPGKELFSKKMTSGGEDVTMDVALSPIGRHVIACSGGHYAAHLINPLVSRPTRPIPPCPSNNSFLLVPLATFSSSLTVIKCCKQDSRQPQLVGEQQSLISCVDWSQVGGDLAVLVEASEGHPGSNSRLDTDGVYGGTSQSGCAYIALIEI